MIVRKSTTAVLAGAVLMAFGVLSGAAAAPNADRGAMKLADATPSVSPAAVVADAEDDMTNCSKARRRLWVESEGWIVRRVTTCR